MLCLFALSMILSAWALPPDEKKVTLDLKDVPMETFLNTVKQKAGINMLYNSKMFKGVEPVTVKATNEPWRELLDRVLSPKGFTYATKDGIVVIKKKDQKTRVLEGRVVDDMGGELPGVTVLILGKERNIGTMTDADGAFSLGLPDGDATIRLSFVGMQSLEIHTGKLNLDKVHTFKLKPDSKQLEEVVVTGYQTISRERATGSFAKVDSKKLETQRLSSVSSLMEGRIAGYSDGKIRGVTSMNGLTTPLYVIDGFPVEKTISDGLGNWVENVPDLNIEDIENITVLKDAAATSIYGARAANGVVVITTKKAGKNQLNVSFSATLTVRPYNFYTGHLAGTADMIEMEKEWAAMNPNLQGEGASQYAQNLLDNASMYSCLGVQAILKHHTGAISEAQMELSLIHI